MFSLQTCGVMVVRAQGGLEYTLVQPEALKQIPPQRLVEATNELRRFIHEYRTQEISLSEQTSMLVETIAPLQGVEETLMATLCLPWGSFLFYTQTQTWRLSLLDLVLYPDAYDEQAPAWIQVLESFCDCLSHQDL